jgi:hypothetical protein
MRTIRLRFAKPKNRRSVRAFLRATVLGVASKRALKQRDPKSRLPGRALAALRPRIAFHRIGRDPGYAHCRGRSGKASAGRGVQDPRLLRSTFTGGGKVGSRASIQHAACISATIPSQLLVPRLQIAQANTVFVSQTRQLCVFYCGTKRFGDEQVTIGMAVKTSLPFRPVAMIGHDKDRHVFRRPMVDEITIFLAVQLEPKRTGASRQ